MESNYAQWKEKVDCIPSSDLAETKRIEFTALRAVFSSMHNSIAKLPADERDKVLVVLARELQQIGVTFSAGVSMRLRKHRNPLVRTLVDSENIEWTKILHESVGLDSR